MNRRTIRELREFLLDPWWQFNAHGVDGLGLMIHSGDTIAVIPSQRPIRGRVFGHPSGNEPRLNRTKWRVIRRYPLASKKLAPCLTQDGFPI